jgi:transposase-like protein
MLSMRWGLGSLPNGEAEVLGIWVQQEEGGPSLLDLYRELHDRGAEMIRVGIGDFEHSNASFTRAFGASEVVGSIEEALEAVASRASARHRLAVMRCLREVVNAENVETARSTLSEFQGSSLGERYPDVVRLCGEALAGFTPIFSLSNQLRVLIRSTDQKAAQVRSQLTQAISRHGPFTDTAAALDFVAVSLARTEQRWDRERAAARAARGARTPHGIAHRSGTLGVATLA